MPDTQLPTSETRPIVRMEKITRRFPGIVANRDVDLTVQPGSFHAVIGENGAGKSTLLNILYGRYRPDSGRIFVQGEEVTQALRSPSDAIQRGLGLVSQHYALIPALTVLENIILGAEPTHPGGALNRRQAEARIIGLAEPLGLGRLDFNQCAERLSVAAGQKVEILKALYRGARILLLDEPTATLAPQEADSLFALLRALLSEGATIVFVTHKLREVMAYSQAVTVLRAGCSVAHLRTAETTEQELLRQMIGPRKASLEPSHHPPAARDTEARREEDRRQKTEDGSPTIVVSEGHVAVGSTAQEFIPSQATAQEFIPSAPLLQIEKVSVRNARRALAVQCVDLKVHAGEIVGIAGVDGSGQRELSEAIIGLRSLASGSLTLCGTEGEPQNLRRLSVRKRQKLGLAYIPEDRHRAGMILDFSIAENYLLGHEEDPAWGGGFLLHPRHLLARAAAMIGTYDVRVGQKDANFPANTLSGGNQQKVVIARALDSAPRLLVACQPTRGLDVEASRFVYETLRAARSQGLGVLLFSLDLDEILELSDRVAVMFNGHIAGILSRSQATPELVGALMTGSKTEKREDRNQKTEEGSEEALPSETQSKITDQESRP